MHSKITALIWHNRFSIAAFLLVAMVLLSTRSENTWSDLQTASVRLLGKGLGENGGRLPNASRSTSGSALPSGQVASRAPTDAIEQAQNASIAGGTEQESLWKAFHAAKHAVQKPSTREAAMPENTGVRLFIANPGQDLTMRFLDSGARLQSGRPGSQWAGTLRLKTTGASAPMPVQTGNARVEYQHPGVTEWYENRREGIEHGFTVSRRPASYDDRGFSLLLEVNGLQVLAEQDGILRFLNQRGEAVAQYSHLKAWDADGKLLQARMEALDSAVAIHISDNTARYPVTIDPLVTSLEQKFVPEMTGDGAAGDEFGRAVAISGDTVVIGAYADDTTSGSDAGSAYVFVRSGASWNLQAKLTANDGAAADHFGWSASINGDTALIGAPHDDLTPGTNVGSAYLFVRSGTDWSLPTRLTAPDGTVNDEFGWAVSVHGESAIVGAYRDDTPAGADAGSAHAFTLSGGSWLWQAHLMSFDAAASDNFGYSVSLEKNTAIVGAYLDDTPGGADAGSAYAFVRSGSVWTQEAKIVDPNGAANDQFGLAVSLSGDRVLVAAALDDTTTGGADSGSALIFFRAGSIWSFEAQLIPGDIQPGDLFGYSVSLSGSTALIGVVDGDNAPESLTGSAYVFAHDGSTWNQQAKLVVNGGAYNDQFGVRLALSGDTAVIGANFRDTDAGLNSGSAYVYARSGTSWNLQSELNAGNGSDQDIFGLYVDVETHTAVIGAQYADTLAGGNSGLVYVFNRSDGIWTLQTTLLGSDVAGGDEFSRCAISGNTIVAAALFWGANQGAAYVFVRSNGSWMQQTKLLADDGAAGDAFGRRVAIDGETILIGTSNDDTAAGTDAGSVYVFVRNNGTWTQQAHLFASDGAAGDQFVGCAISGDTAIIGASRADAVAGPDSGKAYVFVRNGTSWSEQAILTASTGAASDWFGYHVSISGETTLISAHGDDTVSGLNAGSAYVFTRNENVWTELTQLTASDAGAGDEFGHSLDLRVDNAIIGSWSDDTAAGGNAGSVYVYGREGATWTERGKITAPDAATGDFFGGYSVALDEDTLLVSSYTDDTPLPSFLPGYVVSGHGSVYVFRLSDVEIAVEQPFGTNLTDGVATISFGDLNVGGSSQPKLFTIRNSGVTSLLGVAAIKGGVSSSDFTLNTAALASSVAAGDSTSFTLVFSPTTAGTKTASLQITSNDADEAPFDIALTGQAYSSTTDTDSDGMNDWQEFQLAPLGFNWQVDQAAMVNTYFSTANLNGLYTSSQVQDLNVGTLLIQLNATTGEFTLTFGVEKSTDLSHFVPFPMTAPQTLINEQGKLEFRFTAPDNAAFFRLKAQ